jgi:Secretion system C-terminal sorting domain
MKKLYLQLLVFACFLPILSFAQKPRTPEVAPPRTGHVQPSVRLGYVLPDFPEDAPARVSVAALPQPRKPMSGAASKVTAINPIALGTATNLFTVLRTAQNQIVAVDSLDLVAFIHRNDINVYGGSSGHLRYDISINGGTSFSNDIGVLNPTLTRVARYPNIAALNLPGGTNPLDARIVFAAPTLNTAATVAEGHVVGLSQATLSGTPTGTENYILQGQNSYLPGGLCQSAPGIFWTADLEYDGTSFLGDVYVNRGEYNTSTQDIDWVRSDTIPDNNYTGFSGAPRILGPNIAFAPDGQTGWLAWLGDLNGGPDSTYLPVLSKTTDCGNTWSTPVEVNLNEIAWIKDTLQSLWTDSTGNPASDGRATCSFDFDLTVDANGNPHLGVVICSGIDYSVSSGLAKFLGDVTTPDGGANWDVNYISPVLTFRTQLFGTSPQTSMDNFVQVARDQGGCNIFFSWADSDTSLVTGNQNGLGFGESSNLAPNLRVAALNILAGEQTYPRLVSDLDLLWDGSILHPTMAPIVLSTPTGWKLPIVAAVMTGNDPVNPASFWYFGNDAFIPNSGWCSPGSMTLSWDFFGSNSFTSPCGTTPVAFCNAAVTSPCVPVGVDAPQAQAPLLGDAYPNPSNGLTRIAFTLPATTRLQLELRNALGQVVGVLATGEFAAGSHEIDVNTSALAAGIYVYQLRSGDETISKKLVVTR